jgi:predicted O-linked N-acetylglucosamine transferase (SPINDLY family)
MQPHTQPPIPQLVQLLQSGRFQELVAQAASGSTRWPKSGPVWHLLGLAYMNLGQFELAVAPLAQAVKLIPKDPSILDQLATAQMQAGDKEAAYRSFERCLAVTPDNLGVLINAASLANDMRRFAAAERHASTALRRAPGQAEALFNRGRALQGLGRNVDAITTFRSALAGAANLPIAQNDIGLCLAQLGANAEADACFRRAIALQPDFSAPYANLASLLNAQRQFADAEAASHAAIRLDPSLAVAYSNLGNALFGQRRKAEAETAYRQALKLQPDLSDALNNLGNLLQEGKRFDEARDCYRQLSDHDPEALLHAYHCANHLCDWSQRETDEAALRAAVRKGDADLWPFILLMIDGPDAPSLLLQAARQTANRHYATQLAMPPLVDRTTRYHHDRLRIGYISADFHNHATMYLVGGVLAAHDKSRFAIHLYSYGPDSQDRCRKLAIKSADVFRNLNQMSDAEAAAQIVADEIDILVDLNGYTQDNRLGISALRPAPIIISWLGYTGSLGNERLADYIIGDAIATPPEHADRYSGTILRMPHSYQPNDNTLEIGARPTHSEVGLPEDDFVFCCFNQSYKISPTMFDLWCRLLASVPHSVLWLQKPNALAVTNLQREAVSRGIDAKRLIFADPVPLAEHLGRLQLADLALDTAPYGSHTTGSNALWAGVPLLTQPGETFASRVAASLLHAVGLSELVARDGPDFLRIGTKLATGESALAALKRSLVERKKTAPLFDTNQFTHDLESIFVRLYRI